MTPLTKFSIDIFSDIKIDNHVTIVLIFSREISKGVYFMVGIYNEIWKKWIDKEFVKKEVEQLFNVSQYMINKLRRLAIATKIVLEKIYFTVMVIINIEGNCRFNFDANETMSEASN